MAVKKTKNFFFVLRSIHLFLRKQCKGVALLLLHGEQYEWFLNGFSLQEQNHYLAPFSLSHTHTHTHLHAYSIVCTYHAKSLTNKHIPTLSLALSITHTYINYDGMPPPLYLMYLLTHTYSYLSMCYLSIHLSIYLSIYLSLKQCSLKNSTVHLVRLCSSEANSMTAKLCQRLPTQFVNIDTLDHL